MKIFTRERIVYAVIISVFGFAGTYVTARIQASSQTEEALVAFKLETAKEFGKVNGDVQTLKAINTDINRRLESIEGSLQTITSVLLKK